MRVVLFGSDDFSAASLEGMTRAGIRPLFCVTPPDRPRGRGHRTAPCLLKEIASRAEIETFDPSDLRDPGVHRRLDEARADLFVVVSYGRILPEEILRLPRGCCVNVHPSLLPKYRGAAPIPWALIRGEDETGVTLIEMERRMDAGGVIDQVRVSIRPDETAVDLRARLARIGAERLVLWMPRLARGDYTAAPQDEAAATYAPRITKDMSRIDWTRPAREIHDRVRGLLPWPVAFTVFRGRPLKILETKVGDRDRSPTAPGEVISVDEEGIAAATGTGILRILRVHYASGRPMSAAAFARGHTLRPGVRLG